MKLIINSEHAGRTLKRISHEIIEKNENLESIVFFAIIKKGSIVAQKISEFINQVTGIKIPVYDLDISAYRDDVVSVHKGNQEHIEIKDKHVIIVDDVIFTGRSVRAAMDAIIDLGRPAKIELVTLIDRGHRELPIKPNYVGKNIPTSLEEKVIIDNDLNVYINS